MTPKLRLSSDGNRSLPKRINFTESTVNKLASPKDKPQAIVYDSHVPGFALMLGRTGSRVYYWIGRVKGETAPIRCPIGAVGTFTVDTARSEAMEIGVMAAKGINPLKVRRDARERDKHAKLMAETLGKLWARHLVKLKEIRRPRTVETDDSRFNTCFEDWKQREVSTITADDVRAKHDQIRREIGGVSANRAMAVLRKLYNWARIQPNPAATENWKDERFAEKRRVRFLTPDEKDRLMTALDKCGDKTVADVIRMALYTGCRKDNILRMAWRDIDLAACQWNIPAEQSKHGDEMRPRLTPDAIAILKRRAGNKSDYVFAGRIKGSRLSTFRLHRKWEEIRTAAKLDNFHFHDLRHSLATWGVKAGVSLAVLQKQLGHKSSKTTEIYAHNDMLELGAIDQISAMFNPVKPKAKKGGKRKKTG